MGKTERENEAEADNAAISHKLAYRQEKWGVVYWEAPAKQSFRNGYFAGKMVAEAQSKCHPELFVTIKSYPESNGKRNWTAAIERVERVKNMLIGTAGGVCVQGGRGELWNRVAYAAEHARVLLGLRKSEPDILEYGDDVKTPEEWKGFDLESGFVKYHKLFGKYFKIVAEFPDSEEGTKEANSYMEEHAGIGVLAVTDGRVILASNGDKGKG